MRTFAILFNPKTIKEAKIFWPISQLVPDNLFASFWLRQKNPRVLKLCDLSSISGKVANGYVIVYPVSLYKDSGQDDDFIMSKSDNVLLAANNIGSDIIGLCGFGQKLTGKLLASANKMKIPVTNGKTLTAWTVFESVYQISKKKNLNLKDSVLVVIGADESVGALCARKFASLVKEIIISGRDKDRLLRLKETLAQMPQSAKIGISENVYTSVKEADIIVNSEGNFSSREFKPGSIAVSIFGISNNAYRGDESLDITSIQCGLIKLPFVLALSHKMGLPGNVTSSCFAETMLLTLEEKFVNYSSDVDINPDRMDEIADIAAKNGFEVLSTTSFDSAKSLRAKRVGIGLHTIHMNNTQY